jgi:hypothetical protein
MRRGDHLERGRSPDSSRSTQERHAVSTPQDGQPSSINSKHTQIPYTQHWPPAATDQVGRIRPMHRSVRLASSVEHREQIECAERTALCSWFRSSNANHPFQRIGTTPGTRSISRLHKPRVLYVSLTSARALLGRMLSWHSDPCWTVRVHLLRLPSHHGSAR